MAGLEAFLASLVGWVWSLPMVILLVGLGLFFTVYLCGVQFRAFGHGLAVVSGKYDKDSDPGEVTHFKALCSALSATVGLGNIAGVAVAVAVGGPGATFWMIVTGFVGMVTKFVECSLAIKFRRVDEDGVVHGGPMHYIELGLGKAFKPLSVFYCICAIFASFGAVALFQSNQVAVILHNSFSLPHVWVGIALSLLTGVVIVGGIKRIANVASKIVPLMAGIYVLGSLVVLFLNFSEIPAMISLIVTSAFTGTAATGAFVGVVFKEVLIMGVRRACFSNEAGLGTAAIAHSAAKTNEPVREGVVAMLGPFIDTVVICTMTALVIISSGEWSSGLTGIELTAKSFNGALPGFGDYFLPIAVFLFCYSTLISWYYYGERCVDYLVGTKGFLPYQLAYLALVIVGSVWTLDAILNLADSAAGLMVIPNAIALFLLAPKVKEMAKDYFDRLKVGEFE